MVDRCPEAGGGIHNGEARARKSLSIQPLRAPERAPERALCRHLHMREMMLGGELLVPMALPLWSLGLALQEDEIVQTEARYLTVTVVAIFESMRVLEDKTKKERTVLQENMVGRKLWCSVGGRRIVQYLAVAREGYSTKDTGPSCNDILRPSIVMDLLVPTSSGK